MGFLIKCLERKRIMKNKVKIITFHCAYNVGAMLQSYSLSNYIKTLNVDTEIIDYRDSKIGNSTINLFFSKIKKNCFFVYSKELLFYIYRIFKKWIKKETFNVVVYGDTAFNYARFLKRLPLTKNVFYSFEDLKTKYLNSNDVFICGSDQVWNSSLPSDPRPYFLQFTTSRHKNSYAASFGGAIASSVDAVLSSNVEDFNIISIREQDSVEELSLLIHREVQLAIDPVFLSDSEQWKKIIKKPLIKGKYIFLYRTEQNQLFNQIVKEFKKDNPEYKVVIFDSIDDKSIARDYIINSLSPLDFLNYIYYCDRVVTNSFHGMAFSIIFNKNGAIVPHSKYNSRIESVMTVAECSFSDYYLIKGDEINKLDKLIKESKQIISNIIQK